MAHRGRQETLHFCWVTASTRVPGKRGEGTRDEQARGREQAAFLEPGWWPHEILIYPCEATTSGAYEFPRCQGMVLGCGIYVVRCY
jgi:hypothetical protein